MFSSYCRPLFESLKLVGCLCIVILEFCTKNLDRLTGQNFVTCLEDCLTVGNSSQQAWTTDGIKLFDFWIEVFENLVFGS